VTFKIGVLHSEKERFLPMSKHFFKSIIALIVLIPSSLFGENDTLQSPFKDDPFVAQLDSLLYADYFVALPAIDSSKALSEGESVPEFSDSTIAYRLDVLNAQTPIELEYNEHVARFINVYAYNRREQVSRMMGMAHLYFPLFEEVLDKYDMPLELKYLAIVESALNPRAKSRVGATGLWQFMYSTGKMYGLEVSSYVDERSDPIASTEAAAQFMTKLYQTFGDWNLVLAAYNSGPGNVNKAIRRSGGKRTYWEIRPWLPRETRGYVPAFIAVNYVMNYADEYKIIADEVTINRFEVDTVVLKRLMTFEQISALLHIPLGDLKLLNPQYKLDIIPVVKGKQYTLTLPRKTYGVFISNEDSLYAYAEAVMPGLSLPQYVEMNDRIRYKVQSGDYLGRIAIKYGCSVRDIQRWNHLKGTNIRVGQRLTVYAKNVESIGRITGVSESNITGVEAVVNAEDKAEKEIASNATESQEIEHKEAAASTEEVKAATKAKPVDYYIVQRGDTLWDIAKKYEGVSSEQIKKWNNISSVRNLKPGMKLKINTAS
jgi:membrane-bound lytic murein transglycosylase D